MNKQPANHAQKAIYRQGREGQRRGHWLGQGSHSTSLFPADARARSSSCTALARSR